MKKNIKKIFLVLAVFCVVATVGLFLWLGIGQYVAQINYDGQYIEWRTIKDISQWGWMGFASLALAFVFGALGGYFDN